MKLTLIALALVSGLSSAALAEDWSKGLTDNTRIRILQLVPNADLTDLSKDQVQTLEMFFTDSKNLRSSENPGGKIQIILARE